MASPKSTQCLRCPALAAAPQRGAEGPALETRFLKAVFAELTGACVAAPEPEVAGTDQPASAEDQPARQ